MFLNLESTRVAGPRIRHKIGVRTSRCLRPAISLWLNQRIRLVGADRREKGMGFIAFLILGLIAGAIAKQLLPGVQGGGLFMTMLLGVVGALLGGWLGSVLFDVDLGGFFEIRTWLIAIVGSILVLVIYGFFARSRQA
jgi:uncharacterized membrane protein YeaQ/YmgE (transglycosylase-associated protein family)